MLYGETGDMMNLGNGFPNLLADRDFVDYYWTLPFTVL